MTKKVISTKPAERKNCSIEPGIPTFKIFFNSFQLGVKFLRSKTISLLPFKISHKAIKVLITSERMVAQAAPTVPSPKVKIKRGSIKKLRMTVKRIIYIGKLTFPKALIID